MNISEELERLVILHKGGGLSDEEFATAKAQVLSRQPQSEPELSAPVCIQLAPPTFDMTETLIANSPRVPVFLRVPAFVIDLLPVAALLWLRPHLPSPLSAPHNLWIFLLLTYGYMLARDSFTIGGSIGKRICGLVLLRAKSVNTLGPGRAFLRQFLAFLSILIAQVAISVVAGRFNYWGGYFVMIYMCAAKRTLFDYAVGSLLTTRKYFATINSSARLLDEHVSTAHGCND